MERSQDQGENQNEAQHMEESGHTGIPIHCNCSGPVDILHFWFQYRITYNDTLISLRDQAEAIYGYVEKRLDKSTFDLVRTREDMEEMSISRPMKLSRGSGRFPVSGISIPQKMNEDGEFVYLIDCLDQSEPDFRYPGT